MEDKELKRITAKLRQIEKMLDQALELSSNDKVVDRLISVKEAAQMLNISENKLRNEIRCGIGSIDCTFFSCSGDILPNALRT